jgi:hypothetical protein
MDDPHCAGETHIGLVEAAAATAFVFHADGPTKGKSGLLPITAVALKVNSTLASLDLSHNELSVGQLLGYDEHLTKQQGLVTFFEALQQNETLLDRPQRLRCACHRQSHDTGLRPGRGQSSRQDPSNEHVFDSD